MNGYDQDDPFGELEADRDAEIDARQVVVDESWKLRNGSKAHIGCRGCGFAAGTIDGSGAVHVWSGGKTTAGPGYDLMEQL